MEEWIHNGWQANHTPHHFSPIKVGGVVALPTGVEQDSLKLSERTHTTAYPWYGVCAPCHNEVGACLAPIRSSFIGYNVSPEGGVVRPATPAGSVKPAIAEYINLKGVQPL